MKYDSGFTPVPPEKPTFDELRGRIAEEEARLEERKDNFHNTLLPLCDTTSDANRVARQRYYKQSTESKDLFTQYRQYQEQVEQLRYQQTQRRNAAMAQYSGVAMRAQRDKAGAEAGAEFDKQIAQAQGFMSQSFEQYTLQEIQTGLANQENTASRFAQISAFNNAISEGFSLSSAYTDLGQMKQQLGFFEGMA